MIRFILNDKLVETQISSGSSVLDFVRYHKRLTGTKIGCREGDCGACTILVGDFEDGKLVYRSMTSCLLPLGNVNSKHIVTIEGLNMEILSPVQQAMVDANGSQCGFCTIGFVMSLTGFIMNDTEKSYPQAIAAIDGNICRCTGYKSIEKAAKMITDAPGDKPDQQNLSWLVENKYLPTYFLTVEERLRSLVPRQKVENKQAYEITLSGGTDLMVQKPELVKKSTTNHIFDYTEWNTITYFDGRCFIGGSVTVTTFAESPLIQSHFPNLQKYIKLISSTPIRNMATIAGNLVNASPIGDMTVFLLALEADIVLNLKGVTRTIKLRDFYKAYKKMNKSDGELIEQIIFTPPAADVFFNFEKVSKRTHLDIASVNSACQIKLANGGLIEYIHLSAGGVAPFPKYLTETISFLQGKKLSLEIIEQAKNIIQNEIAPISDARGSEEYKRLLLSQLFQAHVQVLEEPIEISLVEASHPILKDFHQKEVGNLDAHGHVTGRSIYTDDIPVMEGTLFLKVFDSPIAHGVIKKIDFSLAEQLRGIVKIFSYKDVPGENQIGGIIADEPLLVEKEVHFQGQPILIIAAENEDAAEEALQLIKIEFDVLPVIIDPREAFAQNKLLSPSRKFTIGDINHAFAKCAYIFEGKAESGGQEHLYLETQGAYAHPTEHNSVKVFSSTQGPTAVQRTISRVLGVGMHNVEVDVARLGGGFGGKEDQASGWAAMAAMVAWILKRPAKYMPHRMEDMRMTGKRNPYSSDYKIGLDENYNILAYEAIFYQNGGAAADLSPAIMERTLFHATNSYNIPNVLITAHSCKTNLPPNTAFRGFGGPQGMFVMESAIDHAAKEIGISASLIQYKNLINNGDEFPYGQVISGAEAIHCWDELHNNLDVHSILKELESFNQSNAQYKKGWSFMPVCFGISFTNTMMNQARALIHVYSDGTVGVSTGAVEMGQSVNTKMVQVVAQSFGIGLNKIKLETTNTTRVANTSPSAASSTADLNGKAVQDACDQIMNRLTSVIKNHLNLSDTDVITMVDEMVYVNDQKSELSWIQVIQLAFMKRENLSAKGHYATPTIHFDKTTEKGHPFAYHVYGMALTITTVDCIRGTYELDAVHVMHDFGSSMNKLVDLGQCEGGIVQGIGWMTMEEIIYNTDGRLMSNALSTYKIPDIYSVPKELNVHFLPSSTDNLAILKSKAVGEPPLMYGIGAYFAIRNAMLAYNPKANIPYSAPLTPEKVLLGLQSHKVNKN